MRTSLGSDDSGVETAELQARLVRLQQQAAVLQAQLDKLGIRDVESSIAAELILFFYPDVYVSGMSNSTLNGSYTAGHTCADEEEHESELAENLERSILRHYAYASVSEQSFGRRNKTRNDASCSTR